MNTYLVSGPVAVLDVEPGGILEHEFSAEEETDLLDGGRVTILPREYRVIGTSNVCNTQPGAKFTAAFPVSVETALFEGGHIERVLVKAPAIKVPTGTSKNGGVRKNGN